MVRPVGGYAEAPGGLPSPPIAVGSASLFGDHGGSSGGIGAYVDPGVLPGTQILGLTGEMTALAARVHRKSDAGRGMMPVPNLVELWYLDVANVTPPAPGATPSSGGGAIPAGSWFAQVTYLSPNGESIAGPQTAFATTGSASKVVITSPAAFQGMTGYNVYVGVAGSGNAPVIQNTTAIALSTNFTMSAPFASTGDNPPAIGGASAWLLAPQQPLLSDKRHVAISRAPNTPATLKAMVLDAAGLLEPENLESPFNYDRVGAYSPLLDEARAVLLRAGVWCWENLASGIAPTASVGVSGGSLADLTDGILQDFTQPLTDYASFAFAGASQGAGGSGTPLTISLDLGSVQYLRHAVIRFGSNSGAGSPYTLPSWVQIEVSADDVTWRVYPQRPVGGPGSGLGPPYVAAGDWDDNPGGIGVEVAFNDIEFAARYVRLVVAAWAAQTVVIDELAVYGGGVGAYCGKNLFSGYLGDSLQFTPEGLCTFVATDGLKKLADNNEVSLTPPFGTGAPNVPTSPTTQVVSGGSLPLSTTYYYVITAVTSHGETGPSTEVSAVCSVSGHESIELWWNPVLGNTNFNSYNIYRGTASGAETLLANTGPVDYFSSPHFVDNGSYTPGTQHPPAQSFGLAAPDVGDIVYTLLSQENLWYGQGSEYDAPVPSSQIGWAYASGLTGLQLPLWQGQRNNMLGYCQELFHEVGWNFYQDGNGVYQAQQPPYEQTSPDRMLIAGGIDGNGDVRDCVRHRTGKNLRNVAEITTGRAQNGQGGSLTYMDNGSVSRYGRRRVVMTDPIAVQNDMRQQVLGAVLRDYAWRLQTLACSINPDFDTKVYSVHGIRAPARPNLYAKACAVVGQRRKQELWRLDSYEEHVEAGNWWADASYVPYFWQPLAPPNILSASTSAGHTDVLVSWQLYGDPHAVTINVYYSQSSSGPWTLAGSAPASTGVQFDVTGLVADTLYWFYVTVVDDRGEESLPSSQVYAVVGESGASLSGWQITDLTVDFVSRSNAADVQGYWTYKFTLFFTSPPAVGAPSPDNGAFGLKRLSIDYWIDDGSHSPPAWSRTNPSTGWLHVVQDEWHGDRIPPGMSGPGGSLTKPYDVVGQCNWTSWWRIPKQLVPGTRVYYMIVTGDQTTGWNGYGVESNVSYAAVS